MDKAGVEHLTPEVTTFVSQARAYSDFIGRAAQLPLPERLFVARERLLGLYAAGAVLPKVEPPDIDAEDVPARPKGSTEFGAYRLYRVVFDPYADWDVVVGDLSDDLLEIDRDVRGGLELWDRPVPRAAAIWEWRFQFDVHWGRHAVSALAALHRACTEEGV